MLKILSRLGPLSTLILYLLNWILKLKYVIYPDIQYLQFNNSHTGLLQFPNVYNLAIQYPITYTIISIHSIFLFALFVNYVWTFEKLNPRNSFLPALSIIIFSSMLSSGFLLSLYFLLAVLLIFVLQLIFSSNIQAGSNGRLFKAGIVMACIVMIKPIFIIVALSGILIILIIKNIDGRSIVAYILGLLLPILFFISLIWLLSPNQLQKLSGVQFMLPQKILNIETLALSLVTIIWLVIHVYFIKQNKSEIGGIQIEKKWASIRVLWFSVLITAIFSIVLPSYSFFILINLSALLLFQCFNLVLNKKWANFTFIILLIVVFINQWVFFNG